MGSSAVSFQTPTALYDALAGQGQAGLFGPTPFPQISGNYGYGAYSPYLSMLAGIQNLMPNNVWTGSGTTGAGTNVASNTNALGQAGASLLPQLNNVLDLGNAASAGGQSVYNTLSPQMYNAILQGDNTASGILPYVNQALQQGFDPQNALFNKLFQQQQDQSRAENAASGVATTPYGAALATQGDQNFDLAWQQQQLQRQATGANTASQLAGAGMGALSSGYGNAANLGSAAIGALGTGANALSSGYGAASNLLGAAGGAIGAPANLEQQQIQDYLNYINSSVNAASAFTGGTNSATNAGANSTNSLVNAQNAANAGKGGIGGALGNIGGLAGKFATGGKGP